MKVLLTGATGFVGSHLAELLLHKGYDVRALIRRTSNMQWIRDLDMECFYGSLDEADSLKNAVKGVDYVFHVAGVTKAADAITYIKGNYEATKNLVEAILAEEPKIKRFVLVSSQAAVGPSPTIEPIDENANPYPLTDYGQSKLLAENYIRNMADTLPVTIVRPPAVFGPRDTDVLDFFKTVKLGIIPRIGGSEKYVSLVYVKDLVRGIWLAGTRSKAVGKTYFIANPRPYSWGQMAELALKVFNKKGIQVRVPELLLKGVALASESWARFSGKNTILNRQKVIEMKQDFWVCSPRLAKKDLRFEAKYSLEEAFKETITWYKEKGWL
jgi:nucleoside-diphosphate-sugar epimerase